MKIILNDTETQISAKLTIEAMLNQQGYGDKLVAVAINGAFAPKSTHSETTLQEGDTVEIVAPMQGG